eukprot:Lithocolla_globosa_v1_NODE_583_length_3681_cov_15.345284.p2 type:complete len:232 gc:universal NODE_583_length_3681_cov_15.345284:1468-773(-)
MLHGRYTSIAKLVIVDVVKNVTGAADFFGIVQQLYVFLSGSHVHDVFVRVQQKIYPKEQPMELKRLLDVRWTCQHSALVAIKKRFEAVYETLSLVSQDKSNPERSLNALTLNNFLDGKFVIQLCCFECLLLETSILAKLLQARDLIMSQALHLIVATKEKVSNMRSSDEVWNKIVAEAKLIMEKLDLEMPAARRVRRPNPTLVDFFVSGSSGQRPPLHTPDLLKEHIWLPV